jgi:hypothetical protein
MARLLSPAADARKQILVSILAFACLLYSGPAVAQEGHPLKGSWMGTWGPSQSHANEVLIVLNWNGKSITGMLNPGTDNMPVKNATLNPVGWVVRFEADGKDRAGSLVTYVVEGKIENLGLPNRSITGTWKSQKESGPFKISRQ